MYVLFFFSICLYFSCFDMFYNSYSKLKSSMEVIVKTFQELYSLLKCIYLLLCTCTLCIYTVTFQTKTPNPELCVQHEQIKIININKETFLTVIVNMIMLVWRDFLTLIICSSMLNSLSDKHCSSFGMLCLFIYYFLTESLLVEFNLSWCGLFPYIW